MDDTLCILPKEYQPLEILGRGSSATVYKARVVASGKMVAVKVLRGEHMRNYAVATAFLNETQLLQTLAAHPALLPIYDHGVFGERYYVAWEYVEALSLKQLIESRTLLPRDVLVIAPGGHLKTGQLWPGQNRPAAGRFLVNHFLYF